jgi:hypothetical protein
MKSPGPASSNRHPWSGALSKVAGDAPSERGSFVHFTEVVVNGLDVSLHP